MSSTLTADRLFPTDTTDDSIACAAWRATQELAASTHGPSTHICLTTSDDGGYRAVILRTGDFLPFREQDVIASFVSRTQRGALRALAESLAHATNAPAIALPTGRTVTLRNVQGFPRITGTLCCDTRGWFLAIPGEPHGLDLVGIGHEDVIARAIVEVAS